jgi:hypothetical protein
MAKIDANRVETKTLDRPAGGVSYLAAGTPPPSGSDPPLRGANRVEARRRVIGAQDQHTGATTEPLDGGALILGVDTRTGEGPAAAPPSSTAPPWVAFLSGSCGFAV